MFLEELLKKPLTRIVIIGVGNAGNNIITELYNLSIQGIQIVAMDTDVEHLEKTKAHRKILIGRDITQGRGSMGDPRIGHLAAEARAQEIAEAVKDADFIIIIAGMGNGTGTGAAPVIAKIARETTKDRTYLEPLIVGITIFPSVTEGIEKIERAKVGINILSHYVDTIVIIKNDSLIRSISKFSINELFESINHKIAKMLGGIIESILFPSLVNIDFADIYSIMKNGGIGLIGMGESQGKDAGIHAVKEALEMLKSEVKTEKYKGTLVHFTVSSGIKLEEIHETMKIIYNELSLTSEIRWGVYVDNKLNKTVRIFLIAIVPYLTTLKEFSKFPKWPSEEREPKELFKDIPFIHEETKPTPNLIAEVIVDTGTHIILDLYREGEDDKIVEYLVWLINYISKIETTRKNRAKYYEKIKRTLKIIGKENLLDRI